MHRSDCKFQSDSFIHEGWPLPPVAPTFSRLAPKGRPGASQGDSGQPCPRVSLCRSTPYGCELSALVHSWEGEGGRSWATPRPSGAGGGPPPWGPSRCPGSQAGPGGQPSLRTDAGPPSASQLGTRTTEGQDPRPRGLGAPRGGTWTVSLWFCPRVLVRLRPGF